MLFARPFILFALLTTYLWGGTFAPDAAGKEVWTESGYEELDDDDCLGCHDDEEIEADTEWTESLYVELGAGTP